MKVFKAGAAAAVAAVLALTATACGGSSDKASSDGGASGGAKDKIVIGIKFDQPGLGLKTPDGKFAGFDVDVATYVAKELGYQPDQIEFKQAVSAERENLLANGDVKLVVATYTINDKRKAKVDFAARTSRPTRTCWSAPTTPRSPRPRTSTARSCARSPAPPRRRTSTTSWPPRPTSSSTRATPSASPAWRTRPWTR